MEDQNVDLDHNIGYKLVISCAVLLPLTWIAVGMRTYARAVLTRSFQIDDWLMAIAQIFFTITCALTLEGVKKGLGKHNKAVEKEEDVVAVLKCQAIATMLYILDMTFIKLSIGIFLLRFAVWAVYKWIIHISLVVITAWSLGQFIWNLFQCIPVENQWDFRIQNGHCASASSLIAAAYALSVLNILSDWLYALLPVAMVWNVKMTKQAKITVIVLLGLGIFASVATLVRLRYLSGLQNAEDFYIRPPTQPFGPSSNQV